jgi:hypothetical protein
MAEIPREFSLDGTPNFDDYHPFMISWDTTTPTTTTTTSRESL